MHSSPASGMFCLCRVACGAFALPRKLLCCLQGREHRTGRAQSCQQCLQRGGTSFWPDGEHLGGIQAIRW